MGKSDLVLKVKEELDGGKEDSRIYGGDLVKDVSVIGNLASSLKVDNNKEDVRSYGGNCLNKSLTKGDATDSFEIKGNGKKSQKFGGNYTSLLEVGDSKEYVRSYGGNCLNKSLTKGDATDDYTTDGNKNLSSFVGGDYEKTSTVKGNKESSLKIGHDNKKSLKVVGTYTETLESGDSHKKIQTKNRQVSIKSENDSSFESHTKGNYSASYKTDANRKERVIIDSTNESYIEVGRDNNKSLTVGGDNKDTAIFKGTCKILREYDGVSETRRKYEASHFEHNTHVDKSKITIDHKKFHSTTIIYEDGAKFDNVYGGLLETKMEAQEVISSQIHHGKTSHSMINKGLLNMVYEHKDDVNVQTTSDKSTNRHFSSNIYNESSKSNEETIKRESKSRFMVEEYGSLEKTLKLGGASYNYEEISVFDTDGNKKTILTFVKAE
tara:strand:+ start:215 stop:1525 length:1311 start_codon:yes stop_codon:yes gene_type:complete